MGERREIDPEDPAFDEAERICADLPNQIEHARQVIRDFREKLQAAPPVNDNKAEPRQPHR
jgi:hypothetical protein